MGRVKRAICAGCAVFLMAAQPSWVRAEDKEQEKRSTTQVTVSPNTPKPLSPEEFQKQMQSMSPMMGMWMSAMLEGMAKKLAEPQMAEYYAAFARNYYNALVKQGFTEEQAMKIVSSTGLPSAGGQQR